MEPKKYCKINLKKKITCACNKRKWHTWVAMSLWGGENLTLG